MDNLKNIESTWKYLKYLNVFKFPGLALGLNMTVLLETSNFDNGFWRTRKISVHNYLFIIYIISNIYNQYYKIAVRKEL